MRADLRFCSGRRDVFCHQTGFDIETRAKRNWHKLNVEGTVPSIGTAAIDDPKQHLKLSIAKNPHYINITHPLV